MSLQSQWALSTSLLSHCFVYSWPVTSEGGARREIRKVRGARLDSRSGGGEGGRWFTFRMVSWRGYVGDLRPGRSSPGFLPSSPAVPAPLFRARPAARRSWGRSRPGLRLVGRTSQSRGGGQGPRGDGGAECPASSPFWSFCLWVSESGLSCRASVSLTRKDHSVHAVT